MDGTFGGGDLISASLAIMLGGEGESGLHDKEVELSTSDITGSQTAVFEYDPADEDPQGDPPGPWDGYSLFTIDLSAVKDDIEALQATIAAIIAILQAHDPDYDPDETPPEDGVQNVVDEEEALEDCRDAVIAKIQEYFPSFDPQTCQDIIDKIEEDEDARKDAEEHEGYKFPEGTPIEPIVSIIGAQDPVEIDGNDYYFVYKSGLSLDRQQTWTYYNVFTTVTNDNTDPYYVTYSCQAYIYRKSDNALVDQKVLLSADYGNMGIGGYFQITGLRIDYTNKTLISDYRSRIWPNDAGEVTGTIVNDISAYLTTQSPNPQYKVRNS